MNKKTLLLYTLIILSVNLISCKKANVLIEDEGGEIFKQGKNGYKFYRIPALLTTQAGTLLAFCEGRTKYVSDAGDIDVIFRRSTDNGATWSSQKIIFNDGGNTCQNPCAVEDKETGTIWLFMSRSLGEDKQPEIETRTSSSTRTVWVSKSIDDGNSWSAPAEVTSTTKNKNWDWYATGPGTGIQIKYGPNQGRLIVPCDHSFYPNDIYIENAFKTGSHVIYSDDHGVTWRYGGTSGNNTTECQVVELADGKGTLLMNSRSYSYRMQRAISYSYNGGESWTNPSNVADLPDPICEASTFRYSWPKDDTTSKSIILFTNPPNTTARINLTLKTSYNEGKTWNFNKLIYSGPSAYSSLTVLKNNDIGILYERGDDFANESIVFEKIKPVFE